MGHIDPAAARDMIARNDLFTYGAPLAGAPAAVVVIHGRGATARSILPLAESLQATRLAWLAPQAGDPHMGGAWYPQSFLAPTEANEPHLGQALRRIDSIVRDLVEAGLPQERIVLAGFSQGACLALDYAARRGGRFGAVLGFSGGLIGASLAGQPYRPLAGTPVFMGSSERDAHIPAARFNETAAILKGLGADVTARLYPGGDHTINADELAAGRALLAPLIPGDNQGA